MGTCLVWYTHSDIDNLDMGIGRCFPFWVQRRTVKIAAILIAGYTVTQIIVPMFWTF